MISDSVHKLPSSEGADGILLSAVLIFINSLTVYEWVGGLLQLFWNICQNPVTLLWVSSPISNWLLKHHEHFFQALSRLSFLTWGSEELLNLTADWCQRELRWLSYPSFARRINVVLQYYNLSASENPRFVRLCLRWIHLVKLSYSPLQSVRPRWFPHLYIAYCDSNKRGTSPFKQMLSLYIIPWLVNIV